MQKLNVGIIGFGTVGAGSIEILKKNQKMICDRVGMEIVIRKIADLDIESDRGISVDPGILTRDAMEVINDPEIDVVVELIGGIDKAKTYILRAMSNGKHVVTANKALLAEYGNELYASSEKNGVRLSFEASVCGGIPVVGALRNGLCGNNIMAMMGILNGTSNYILTRMCRDGISYDLGVKEAVKLGFAEDPPTLDVDGTDAAHKLVILISIAFGYPFAFKEIFREGISALTPDDIRFAGEFGFSVKLLAIARNHDGHLEARVHPAMIPKDHILANVNEAYNALYLEGDFVGPNLYYGMGAGGRPTGSAVLSDIMDLARQMRLGLKGPVPPLAHIRSDRNELKIQPIEDLTTAYYFRFSALDRPGVLSRISGILGKQEISISSVIQKGRDLNGSVPIVMLTHEAKEKNVQKALSLMEKLEILTDKTIMIRVEDR
jgi:homoserine dehydrogenase